MYKRQHDQETALGADWRQENTDRVLRVACAILGNPNTCPDQMTPEEIIDKAADIVRLATERAE